MAEHLEEQGLLAYEEWEEYTGYLPGLASLSAIDFSLFDSEYVVGLAQNVDEEVLSPEIIFSLLYEMPNLEYLNSHLSEHGLRLVDLVPFENAYMIAVRDNEQLLERLSQYLQQFSMDINPRIPLDKPEASAYFEQLLAAKP